MTAFLAGRQLSLGTALIQASKRSGSLGKMCFVTPGGGLLLPYPILHPGATQDIMSDQNKLKIK
jgi:hypothetical protein